MTDEQDWNVEDLGLIDVRDTTIQTYTAGSGPSVILLHGMGSTSRMWRKVVDEISTRYKAVIPDLRGFGGSGRPRAGYDKTSMAKDIVALSDVLGIKEAHIVGHDIGGAVAYALAADYPTFVKSLTMLETSVPGVSVPTMPSANQDGIPFWHVGLFMTKGLTQALAPGNEVAFIRSFFDFFAEQPNAMSDPELQILAQAYKREGSWSAVEAAFTTFASVDEADNEARQKRRLDMPVLAIGGTLNKTAVRDAMELLATEVFGECISSSGHWIAEESPTELLKQLMPFLDSSQAQEKGKSI